MSNTVGLTSPALKLKEVALMKRIIVLLKVVSFLVMMAAMTVKPAFAKGAQPYGGSCEAGGANG